jgi:hypothetical protein
VAIFQLHPEGRIWEVLDYLPLHLDYVFFRHIPFVQLYVLKREIDKGRTPRSLIALGTPPL